MDFGQPATPPVPEAKKGRSLWVVIGIVFGLLVLAGVLWAACGRQTTPEPPVLPEITLPPATDPVCERVDAVGKIIIGTAGDYPPFEYYPQGRTLDGFDIALMKQVGLAMGKPVEFRDYAFQGLLSAIQLGEIDGAIAAITVTDQRASQVAFSQPYYFGRGAAVVRTDSGIASLSSAADMAGKRIGVERATVYESWAEENLVAAGVIPATSLFAYEKADHAVRDLLEQRVDVVLLDDQVAKTVATDPQLMVAGEGPVGQSYAIAVPMGANCWLGRINDALVVLESTGTIDDLAQEYIGIVPPPAPEPTPGAPTPVPVPTATPAVCTDSSQYVMDLTYDDQGGTNAPDVAPGQNFTKGWRIRNSGTCTWTDQYRLDYVGGNNNAALMDGEPVYVVGQVSSGQTYDFYVDLTAPSGVYGEMVGRWQMVNPVDQAFGQTVFVMVDVIPPDQPTPSPQPTRTPEPTATGLPTQPPQPTATPEPTVSPNPLEGLTFGFYAIGGQPTLAGAMPTLAFGSEGVLSGYDGCNMFQGSYAVQPAGASQGALTIVLGPGTTLACPEDVMTQAQTFMTALSQVTAYSYSSRNVLLALLDITATEILSGQLQ